MVKFAPRCATCRTPMSSIVQNGQLVGWICQGCGTYFYLPVPIKARDKAAARLAEVIYPPEAETDSVFLPAMLENDHARRTSDNDRAEKDNVHINGILYQIFTETGLPDIFDKEEDQ